ncbi:MAG: 4Fe-4S binding protein [Bacilli bacterium]|nr:4Fe-4S binding protein [Bacilli bacterium]MBN2877465.1 4Fe-4S binding protein [Bacilli bacterium]
MNLKTSFDGMTFENPLMPAAGPLNGDLEKLQYLVEEGCGGIVTKTISVAAPQIPKPCIYGDNQFIMNSELWSEHSYQTWLDDFLPKFHKTKDRPLIVSLGYSKEDMEFLVPKVDQYADAFEISTHYVGTDLSQIQETVRAIRRNTRKPIYMKISPHIPNPEGFAKAIKEAGANGVVAINSLGPTMKIDLDKRASIYNNDKGFVWTSGPAIKPIALATVYKIKQAEPELTVIGVGGIATADDVLEFLLAGASAVQMLSAALLRGKNLYSKIIADLPKALEKHGFHSIEEVIQTNLTKDVVYKQSTPVLIEEKCTKCRLCERICPYFAIEFKDKIIFDSDKCFECGLCIAKCPTKAIRFE